MSIQIIQIGKEKHSFISEGILEYQRRMKYPLQTEMITLKASENPEAKVAQKEEAKTLSKQLDSTCVLLHEKGQELNSVTFAEFLQKNLEKNGGKLKFVIGGSYGFDQSILAMPLPKISLSKMTLTHEMIRLVLMEQIFRAGTILNNQNYHH